MVFYVQPSCNLEHTVHLCFINIFEYVEYFFSFCVNPSFKKN